VKVALVGQPNCGKSTLFNAVAGYRSLTSNFAGTTVEYTLAKRGWMAWSLTSLICPASIP